MVGLSHVLRYPTEQRFDRIFKAMLITEASRIFQPWIE
jgi:hypothetical protein